MFVEVLSSVLSVVNLALQSYPWYARVWNQTIDCAGFFFRLSVPMGDSTWSGKV